MKNSVIPILFLATALVSCKNETGAKAAETAQTAAAPVVAAAPTALAGTQCFRSEKNKDVSLCQITIDANGGFSGYYEWLPFEKDGAHGILKNGKKEGDLYVADFVYMIEGSVQTEESIFKFDGKNLMKVRSEYEEKNGKLVNKDRTKLEVEETMPTVDCAILAENIKNIDSMKKILK